MSLDKRNFNVNITTGDATIINQEMGSFKTYVVMVNTFVIATFLSELDQKGFVQYLKERGIAHLPQRIINHIRDLSYLQNLGNNGIKPLN